MNKTDKVFLLIENQNLRKTVEHMREDIAKHCIDSKYSQMSDLCGNLRCERCVLSKWVKENKELCKK